MIVGELRDPKMLEEIISGLKERGIPAESQYSKEHDIYLIMVTSPEYLAPAQDFYRVKLGINKPVEIDQQWVKIKSLPRGKTTYALMLICYFIFGLSYTEAGTRLYSALFIGNVESGFFYEVSRGQFWRLLTPIMLHMGFMHIIFNMLWFKDLGYMIENVFGKYFLIKFIILSGLVSNVCQYLISGPQFGGMSGVLYGMLGFIWVHKKLNENFEFSLPKFDIGMMIGWYFLCLSGLLGLNIANTAHGAGLVAGILVAVFLDFKWDKLHALFLSIALFFLIFTVVVEGYKLGGRYYFLLATN